MNVEDEKKELSKYMKCKQIITAWFNVIASIERLIEVYNEQGMLVDSPRIRVDEGTNTLLASDLIGAIYNLEKVEGLSTSELPKVLPGEELYKAIEEIEGQLLKVVSSTQMGDVNKSQLVNARNSTEDKLHRLLQYKETIVRSVQLFVKSFNELDERERVVLICRHVNKKRDADINFEGLGSSRTINRVRDAATIKLVEEIAIESYLQGSFFV